MLPQTLSEWSIDAVIGILMTGVFETDTFDFKEKLPDSRDNKAKIRLRKTCCAFANSDGGFIIFGVVDDKSKTPAERLIGLDSTFDFPEHFGYYPRDCSPSIYWSFRNPPISLDNGKVLHIVHLPKSWKVPHAVGNPDEGWQFLKRTNKGNEGMSIEEVRLMFLGYYEKRLKLQLLRAELVMLGETADTAYISDEKARAKAFIPVTFDTHVIESVISDTYTIIADRTELLKALTKIRRQANFANNRLRLFLSMAALPMTGKEKKTKEHNEWLQQVCEEIQEACTLAIKELDRILV
ncbi:MAG: hypothetical protein GY797_24705 [Deltaproteobacteria bacterium]|nr:hypothetical protein [Deltaproteobacteria bacterium]